MLFIRVAYQHVHTARVHRNIHLGSKEILLLVRKVEIPSDVHREHSETQDRVKENALIEAVLPVRKSVNMSGMTSVHLFVLSLKESPRLKLTS